jgi:hypothetical protein
MHPPDSEEIIRLFEDMARQPDHLAALDSSDFASVIRAYGLLQKHESAVNLPSIVSKMRAADVSMTSELSKAIINVYIGWGDVESARAFLATLVDPPPDVLQLLGAHAKSG